MDLIAQANRGHEALAPCFLLALFGFVTVVILLVHWGWQASFRQKLQQVARHLRGSVVSRGDLFAGFAEVHFEHAGFPAEIRFSKRGKGSYYTHVEIRWAGPRFRCEIYPESFLASLRKLMGMQDIIVGSPQFDSAFVITGDDEPGIKALLNGQVQSAIFHLSSYVSGMHVRMGSQSLTVTCGPAFRLRPAGRVREAVRRTVRCGNRRPGAGIEFLEGEPAVAMTMRNSTDARCMVCGEALVSQVVYCRSCKTPHHRDCWSYGGGCSTYGCGEKKYVAKI
jgi:hypothetical protein